MVVEVALEQPGRGHHVVVHEQHERRAGALHAGVARGGPAARRAAHGLDGREAREHLRGGVGGAVVHDDDLEWSVHGLGLQRLEAAAQRPARLRVGTTIESSGSASAPGAIGSTLTTGRRAGAGVGTQGTAGWLALLHPRVASSELGETWLRMRLPWPILGTEFCRSALPQGALWPAADHQWSGGPAARLMAGVSRSS